MAGIAWVNGRLQSPEEPALAPTDGGFLYGEGLFETMRAYRGRAFLLDRHLTRLLTAAADLSFTPPTGEVLAAAVEETLRASGLLDASVG